MMLLQSKCLCVEEPFSGLYPIKSEILDAVISDMKVNGYNEGFPLHVWVNDKKYVVLDGHTRLKAAKACGIGTIPCHVLEFKTELEALEYAIRSQRDRRNLSKEELTSYITRAIAALDHKDKTGRPSKELAQTCANKKSSEHTASIVGVSPRQVDKVRAVLDSKESGVIDDLMQGKISINAAEESVKELKKDNPKTFNQTNDNIEWASWSWNPITGCKLGCKYCYARDIAVRFFDTFDPTFHEDRLQAPTNTKPTTGPGGNAVFVCSMADLFGDWVPIAWIRSVLEQVEINPQWTFIFLTKNPKRLIDFEYPDNAWVGTTVDTQARAELAEKYMPDVSAKVKFLSCEPLLEKLRFKDMSFVQWVIIGGQSKTTQEPAFQPDWDWVFYLTIQAKKAGCKIYWKPNLTVRPKEYPTL